MTSFNFFLLKIYVLEKFKTTVEENLIHEETDRTDSFTRDNSEGGYFSSYKPSFF